MVLDWHKADSCAPSPASARGYGIERDWHAMANDGGGGRHIVGQVHPAFHMDDVHRRVDETPAEFDLEAISVAEREELWRTLA